MNTLDKSITIDVLVNGHTIKIIDYKGNKYIQAKNGTEYELLITNNNWRRMLVIPSIDGINVISGNEASPEDTGYIINGYSNLKVKGFRISNDKVASFKFAPKEQSYSKQVIGNSNNCGVIGLCGFFEYQEPVQFYNINTSSPIFGDNIRYTCNNSNTRGIGGTLKSSYGGAGGQSVNFCSTSNTIQDDGFNLGTDWGQSKVSKVTTVDFKRGESAGEISIYYATRQSLLNMDIPLDRVDNIYHPKAFPNQYCKIKSGWRE